MTRAASDHAGHCHALTDWPGAVSAVVVCCRPKGHTGAHTTCGLRSTHIDHGDTCWGWRDNQWDTNPTTKA